MVGAEPGDVVVVEAVEPAPVEALAHQAERVDRRRGRRRHRRRMGAVVGPVAGPGAGVRAGPHRVSFAQDRALEEGLIPALHTDRQLRRRRRRSHRPNQRNADHRQRRHDRSLAQHNPISSRANAVDGSEEVSWLPSHPPAPSRPGGQWLRAARAVGFLGHSGGPAPVSHRLPCPPIPEFSGRDCSAPPAGPKSTRGRSADARALVELQVDRVADVDFGATFGLVFCHRRRS